jgi:putative transposase
LYEKKTNKVTDFLHKASRSLARQYDTIYVEDLAVKSMSEGNWTNLNKAIRNTCLGRFVSFLEYKVHNLIKVNPRNTTKMHNSCGYVNDGITLKDRIITCPCCQETYDRDENAAKNVYCLGQTIQRLLVDGCIYTVEELKNFTVVEAFAYGKSSSKVTCAY